MSQSCLVINIGDSTEREASGDSWNDLWAASSSRLPISRWEQIGLWKDTFTPQQTLQALIIERDGRWIAGMPLVRRSLKGVLPVFEVPHDDWTGGMELLVAKEVAGDETVYDQLAAALRRLRVPLYRITQCPELGTPMQRFVHLLARKGSKIDCAPRHEVGVIDFTGPDAPPSWEAYQASWSGNFRRQMRKMARRAQELGGVELVALRPKGDETVAKLVRQGFKIEDRSWKGRQGSSVLRSPGMLDYFTRQAQDLARRNELVLLFLKHGDALIAFEYGWSCRRVYYSPKVGFDENYAHLSPGQMLRYLWVERLFADQSHDRFDFSGPLSEATEKWSTSRYAMSRMFVGNNYLGNSFMSLYQLVSRIGGEGSSIANRCRQYLGRRLRPSFSGSLRDGHRENAANP